MLDGKPIVMVATGIERPSRNEKTGPMIQTWILREDMNPLDAVRTGEDASICGACPLKGEEGKKRVCYVNIARSPNQIWKTLSKTKPFKPRHLFNVGLRFGSYGDPAAVPFEVLEELAGHAHITTGYTHQWRTCDQRMKSLLMASCDSPEDREEAKAMGWATFRVKTENAPKLPKEATCPASEEAGKIMTCYNCGMCRGGDTTDVVINVHGVQKHFFNKPEETL